jgi:hypothetical protein
MFAYQAKFKGYYLFFITLCIIVDAQCNTVLFNTAFLISFP